MKGLPAKCRKCGKLFEYKNHFIAKGSENVGFSASFIRCVFCDGVADILDGTYDRLIDEVTIKDMSPENRAIVDALSEALDAVKSGKNEDVVLGIISNASPHLGKAVHEYKRKQSNSLYTIIVAIMTLMAATIKLDVKLDINVLVDQLHVYLSGQSPYPGLANESESRPERQRTSEQRLPQKPQSKRRTRRLRGRQAQPTATPPKGSLKKPR